MDENISFLIEVIEEKKAVENSATIPISMTLMVFSVIKS